MTITAPSHDLILTSDLPETIAVQVQTTRDRVVALDANSIRAELALDDLSAGVHRVSVDATLADKHAQVISPVPAFFDVTLDPWATLTLSPTVAILDPHTLPPGYVPGKVSTDPGTVVIQGPQSLVERVAEAKIELALDSSRADFQQMLPLKLLDDSGQQVAGLQPTPETVLVTVPVLCTFHTREVAIQATLDTDSLETGYEVTRVRLSPPVVTLRGSSSALEAVGDFLITAQISLTNVHSDLTIDVPLILPEGVSALDAEGKGMTGVVAHVTVAPVAGYLVLAIEPTLTGVSSSLSVQLLPQEVTVLLIGPQPLLAQVQEEPGLIIVSLDLAGREAGTYLLPLEAYKPEDLQVKLFPPETRVTLVGK